MFATRSPHYLVHRGFNLCAMCVQDVPLKTCMRRLSSVKECCDRYILRMLVNRPPLQKQWISSKGFEFWIRCSLLKACRPPGLSKLYLLNSQGYMGSSYCQCFISFAIEFHEQNRGWWRPENFLTYNGIRRSAFSRRQCLNLSFTWSLGD